MKQFQTAYCGKETFQTTVSEWKDRQGAGSALIHIFSDGAEKSDIASACAIIDEIMPDAVYVGSSASGCIYCSKLQGFYFGKPAPLAELKERYNSGRGIGFEDPAASGYFDTIGRVNLYDLDIIASQDEDSVQNAFNTLPMAMIEVKGDAARFVRTNPFWGSASSIPSPDGRKGEKVCYGIQDTDSIRLAVPA